MRTDTMMLGVVLYVVAALALEILFAGEGEAGEGDDTAPPEEVEERWQPGGARAVPVKPRRRPKRYGRSRRRRPQEPAGGDAGQAAATGAAGSLVAPGGVHTLADGIRGPAWGSWKDEKTR